MLWCIQFYVEWLLCNHGRALNYACINARLVSVVVTLFFVSVFTFFIPLCILKSSHKHIFKMVVASSSVGVSAVCEPVGNRPCNSDSAVSCCDIDGEFLTTLASCHVSTPASKEPVLGYCKAGKCAHHVCKKSSKSSRSVKPSNRFCGASNSNPCKAACKFVPSGECHDTATSPDGGEHLADGAICLKDRQKGAFRSGVKVHVGEEI